MTGARTDVLAQPKSERGRARPRPPVVLSAVIIVEGAALAVLAGVDGSPVWRVARVLVVIAVTGPSSLATTRDEETVPPRPGPRPERSCKQSPRRQ
jgi:hypothetical protein